MALDETVEKLHKRASEFNRLTNIFPDSLRRTNQHEQNGQKAWHDNAKSVTHHFGWFAVEQPLALRMVCLGLQNKLRNKHNACPFQHRLYDAANTTQHYRLLQEPCPMTDEPEQKGDFHREMSLKRGSSDHRGMIVTLHTQGQILTVGTARGGTCHGFGGDHMAGHRLKFSLTCGVGFSIL